MNAPQWAHDLVWEVLADEGRGVDAERVTLQWRRSRPTAWRGRSKGTSGRCFGSLLTPDAPVRIVITAGTERKDQRLTLLHELAHALTAPEIHHGSAFWILAFALFDRYGVPPRYALTRSIGYRDSKATAARKRALQRQARGLVREGGAR